MYYVYVLKSQKSATLYIGFSSDLKRRIQEHNSGTVVSTKSGIPWQLVYYEAYLSQSDARKREVKLKEFKSSYGFLKRRIADSLARV